MFWEDIKELLAVMALYMGAALVILAIILGLGAARAAYACANYGEMTNRTTDYNILVGCYVNTESGWQLWDEYKARAVASEGLKD